MKFKIPFTFSRLEALEQRSKPFLRFVRENKKSKMDLYLANIGVDLKRKQYLSICYRNFVLNFIIFSFILTTILGLLRSPSFYLLGLGSSFLIAGFIFINQVAYPKIFVNKKSKDIEKNLLPALKDMMIQLNSGVPLFQILANLSNSDYGEFSEELKKITLEISSGTSQIEAFENSGRINVSPYFKRILWQISNGMRAGSDMNVVISESIKNLSEEQAIQMQSYGSKLNPIVMLYMLIAVILPSLGITFFIIISSLLNLGEGLIKVLFFVIFSLIVLLQILFLGLIKSKRPSLL